MPNLASFSLRSQKFNSPYMEGFNNNSINKDQLFALNDYFNFKFIFNTNIVCFCYTST